MGDGVENYHLRAGGNRMPGRSMRVLIVEDDRALGAFLKTGLESEGHRVEWVEDGEAALTRRRRILRA